VVIEKIRAALARRLRQERIQARIVGREKHPYSIYRKMREKHLNFTGISDLHAFRIIVQTVSDCYQALGVIHGLYRPVPYKFKDYIAIPKSNGYQSLHTVLFGPHGQPIEVQIRTEEMDRLGENGIAAHWLYKAQGGRDRRGAHRRAREWLHGVLELQKNADTDPEEFLDNIKIDLFPDEVYLFTPMGDILKFPRGATVIDMAYAIHTDVGHRCCGARINNRHVPLSTRLESGQTVEIITAADSRPRLAWLSLAATARARTHVRNYLKTLRLEEARALARQMLDMELEARGTNYAGIDHDHLHAVLQRHGVADEEQLLREIGLGNLLAPLIAGELATARSDTAAVDTLYTGRTLIIDGKGDTVMHFARCCYPIPGDIIAGYMSPGRGIIIHRDSCKNIQKYRRHREKWIDVVWSQEVAGVFLAGLMVNGDNHKGMLATIASCIASQDSNIIHVEIKDSWAQHVGVQFEIEVRDRQHLARVIRDLRGIKKLSHIHRM